MMPRLSRTPRRLSAMLLIAALAVVQVCTGFTAALADSANIPAATASDSCCTGGSEPDCATAQATDGAVNTCAPYCIQGRDAAKSDSFLPVSATITYAAPPPIARAVFPPYSARLSAARAANSTPLIYQFQRLLN